MQLKKFKKMALTMFLCADMVATTIPVQALAAEESVCQNVTDNALTEQGEDAAEEQTAEEEATEEVTEEVTEETTEETQKEDIEETTAEEKNAEEENVEAIVSDVIADDVAQTIIENEIVDEIFEQNEVTVDLDDAETETASDSLIEAVRRAKAAATDEEIISALEELEALCLLPDGMYAEGQTNGYHWVIDSSMTFKAIPDASGTCNFSTAGWEQYKSVIKNVVVDVPYSSNLSGLFEGCVNLETAVVKIDRTSGSADAMFADCIKLKSLDIEKMNTAGVTSMRRMFGNCEKLDGVILAKTDTSNVTDMAQMFMNCSSLKGYNFSGVKTSNVRYMNKMFAGCSSLEYMNISGFDTVNVQDMSNMFQNCSKLMTLDLTGCRTSKVMDMSMMFAGCSNLKALAISTLDTTNVTDMSGMFEGCATLPTAILTNFKTPNVTDMSRMFSGCKSLVQVDLQGFTNQKVENVSGMFSGCSSLTSIDLSRFKTSTVKDMSSMFEGCAKLTKPDVSTFMTSNVTSMYRMFYGCSAATKIDVSSFNTSNVINAEQMFSNCSSLKTLDLSNFNFAKLQGAYHTADIVLGCNALTTLRTPKNIPLNYKLPTNGNWYRDDTKEIAVNMPTFQTKSIYLVRETVKLADVPTTGWEYAPIRFVVDAQIMNGTGKMSNGDILFSPSGKITRAQFVQTLYNYEKTPAVAYENIFTDVPNLQWFSASVIWAYKNGITAGVSQNTFGTNNNITRQEMALMLFKYAQNYKKLNVSKRAALNGFTDYTTVDTWAVEALQWAVGTGVMSGKAGANNTKILDPKGTASRAECAAMIRNFINAYGY